MKRVVCLMLIMTTLLIGLPAKSAAAEVFAPTEDCRGGQFIFINGSNTCLWVPPDPYWNHDLLIFAHGYVDPARPDGEIPWDQVDMIMPNLPQVVMGLGYAFAVPSYSKNGLAVVEGVKAVIDLAYFGKANGVNNVFLFGASEGGLIAAQAIERNPDKVFRGGVTACGPVGDFRKQVNYWGDFRVLFDAMFPIVVGYNPATTPPTPIYFKDAFSAVHINGDIIDAWNAGSLKLLVGAALQANPLAALELMRVSTAPFNPTDLNTIGETTLGILDYNIKATNEARQELGKPEPVNLFLNDFQPFDNESKRYVGSSNDWLLNQAVARFKADPRAIEKIKALYQTSGSIKAPLVALHTIGDPIVPYWHELLYRAKIWQAGKGLLFTNIPILRYGHCAFTAQEAIFAFAYMIFRSTGKIPPLPSGMLGDNAVLTMEDYTKLKDQYIIPDTYIPIVTR